MHPAKPKTDWVKVLRFVNTLTQFLLENVFNEKNRDTNNNSANIPQEKPTETYSSVVNDSKYSGNREL